MRSRTVLNRVLFLTALILGTCSAVAAGNHSKQTNPRSTAAGPTVVSIGDYGAIGDGVADDAPALQRAIDDLATKGGGTLQIPSAKYRLATPVVKQFAAGLSLTIEGVPSNTPIEVAGNGKGLNLTSEFIVAVGEENDALVLRGLESLLLKDVAFIGVQWVMADARAVIALLQIKSAKIQHCEFYGLLTLAEGGAIVSAIATDLVLEQTAFLGCGANSAHRTSVVQNIFWLGVEVRDCKFIDYGTKPGFFSKTPFQLAYTWIMVGNPVALEPSQSRREAIVNNVFLDEGAYLQLAAIPEYFSPEFIPFELYLSRLNVNVNNLFSSGVFVSRASKVFIDRSNFGWSQRAAYSIDLNGVGNVILDLIKTSADATRLHVSAQRLTVLNSEYASLESVGPATVITTDTPEKDPAQFVRMQYLDALNRDPDPAGHFYWTEKILDCENNPTCVSQTHALLDAFLNTSPAPKFSLQGTVVDEEGLPLSGVSMSLTGSQSTSMSTGSDGRYAFDKLATAGEYQITATKTDYSFQPRILITPNSNVIVNFTAGPPQFRISGHVVTNSGSPLSGATVKLSGGAQASATTDPLGNYSFPNLTAGRNYTLEVSHQNYTFSPASTTIANISADQVVNFQAVANQGVPVLIHAADPSRALALDLVERVAEPFRLNYDYAWSPDRRARIVVYVENVDLSAADSKLLLYAEMEDSSRRIYPLTVEYTAPIPDVATTNRIVVRLSDDLTVGGDYLIRISYRGVFSQSLLIGIADSNPEN